MGSAKLIGRAKCPICGSATARASLMSTNRVCIVCNSCKLQVFSRGEESDELMRGYIEGAIPRGAPAAAPEPEPAALPVAPQPAPEQRQGWGLLR